MNRNEPVYTKALFDRLNTAVKRSIELEQLALNLLNESNEVSESILEVLNRVEESINRCEALLKASEKVKEVDEGGRSQADDEQVKMRV